MVARTLATDASDPGSTPPGFNSRTSTLVDYSSSYSFEVRAISELSSTFSAGQLKSLCSREVTRVMHGCHKWRHLVDKLLQECVLHVRTVLSHICCVLFLKRFFKNCKTVLIIS